jgi:anti-sigma factor RsiW
MAIEPTTLVAAMDCSELERVVDAYLDGEFDAAERAEADAHLARCERCRGHVEAQRRIRIALRARLREAMAPPADAGRAPPALRARIEEAFARQRVPLWRRAMSPLRIGALVACAAGALLVFGVHDVIAERPGTFRPDALVEDAVSHHHRALPLEASAAAIPGWFVGKLEFNASPPRFGADGVHVLGARLSHLRERDAAYIRYELPHGHAGLFIVDDPSRRFAASGREVQAGAHLVRLVNARGYNVAVWRENEIVYSLVSDLDESALYELVRTVQESR